MSQSNQIHSDILDAHSRAVNMDSVLRLMIKHPYKDDYITLGDYLAIFVLSWNTKSVDSIAQKFKDIFDTNNNLAEDAAAMSIEMIKICLTACTDLVDKLGGRQDVITIGSMFSTIKEYMDTMNESIKDANDISNVDLTTFNNTYQQIVSLPEEEYMIKRVRYLIKVSLLHLAISSMGYDATYAKAVNVSKGILTTVLNRDIMELFDTPTIDVEDGGLIDYYQNVIEAIRTGDRSGINHPNFRGVLVNAADAYSSDELRRDILSMKRITSPDYYMSVASMFKVQQVSSFYDIQPGTPHYIFKGAEYYALLGQYTYYNPVNSSMGVYRSFIDEKLDIIATSGMFYNFISPIFINVSYIEDIENFYTSYGIRRRIDIVNEQNTIKPIEESVYVLNNDMDSGVVGVTEHIPTHTSVRYYPTYNDSGITVEDGPDIFNMSVPSQEVPYIIYVDAESNIRSKLFTGTVDGKYPNYKALIDDKKIAKSPNSIYVVVWSKSFKNSSITKIARASLFISTFNLETGTLDVETLQKKRSGFTKKTSDAVNKSLYFLTMGEGTDIMSRGNFKITEWTFEESSFMDAILNSDILRWWLSISEDQHTIASKKTKQLTFVHSSPFNRSKQGIDNSLRISAKRRVSSEDIVTNVFTSNGMRETVIKAGDKYLHCTYRTDTNTSMPKFLNILPKLLEYFTSVSEMYDFKYRYLHKISGLIPPQAVWTSDKSRTTAELHSDESLGMLIEHDPGLFTSSYNEVCAKTEHPVVVEDVESWEELDAVGRSGVKRKVLHFSRSDGTTTAYGCNKTNFPFVGVRTNSTSTSDGFPYAPCCFPTPQMGEDGSGFSKLYQKYTSGVLPLQYSINASSITKKRYALQIDEKAFLPADLIKSIKDLIPGPSKTLVRNGSKVTKGYNSLIRSGVHISQSSIIHCIIITGFDSNSQAYLDGIRPVGVESILGTYTNDSSQYENDEGIVANIRMMMANSIDPSLVSQEMLSYNYEDRIKYLSDRSSFLDPAIAIRAIEEYFLINLYCYYQGSETSGVDSGSVMIPIHDSYYTRQYIPGRINVLCMITRVRMNINGVNIQCEPIAAANKTSVTYIFADAENESLHSIPHDMVKDAYNMISIGNEGYDKNLNMERCLDDILPGTIESQSVDRRGKVSYFNVDYQTNKYSVFTEPHQPINIKETQEFTRCSSQLCLHLFGTPSSHSIVNGRVDGYWYTINSRGNGMFIPLNGEPERYGGNVYDSPVPSSGKSIIVKRRILERTNLIINEVIFFLYSLYVNNDRLNSTVKEFVIKYLSYTKEYNGDSADFYDVSAIPRLLPKTNSIETAITELNKTIPSLITERGILCYSKEYYDRLKTMISSFRLKMSINDMKIIRYIRGYYTSSSDYIKQDNTSVFHTEKELIRWKESIELSTKYEEFFKENNVITPELSDKRDPFVFNMDGNYYLIQNASYNSDPSTIAKVWRDKGYNPGFEVKGSSDEEYDIFCIDSDGKLVLCHKSSIDNGLKTIYYGSPQSFNDNTSTSNGGALLPL